MNAVDKMAPRQKGDRLQVDIGGNLRARLDHLIETDPVFRNRTIADAIRLILDDALPALPGDVEIANSGAVEFLKALAEKRRPDVFSLESLADELGVSVEALAELVRDCCCTTDKEEKKRSGKTTT